MLVNSGAVPSDRVFVSPDICPRYILQEVHSFAYLLSLSFALCVSKMVEVPVCCVPAPLLRMRVLTPMLYATHGSLGKSYSVAACISLVHGWAVNLSGGYHHCSGRNGGGGFCVYADITLVVRMMRLWYPYKVTRVTIVDLDAHQGNGHERDFINDENVYIIDFYNPSIYPNDTFAKNSIRHTQHIHYTTTDQEYCRSLETALEPMYRLFQPDLVIYNAGTDCMEGDPLGGLSLTQQGIVMRDEIVVRMAVERNVPVVMLLSGGYQKTNAPAIAASVANLIAKFHK